MITLYENTNIRNMEEENKENQSPKRYQRQIPKSNLKIYNERSNICDTADKLKLSSEKKKRKKQRINKLGKKNIIIERKIDENGNGVDIVNVNNFFIKSQKNIYNTVKRNNQNNMNNNNVVRKITNNKFFFYCLFFCYANRKTKENKLLEEGMNLIRKNLDIINIFKKINKNEETVRYYNQRSFSIRIKPSEYVENIDN